MRTGELDRKGTPPSTEVKTPDSEIDPSFDGHYCIGALRLQVAIDKHQKAGRLNPVIGTPK